MIRLSSGKTQYEAQILISDMEDDDVMDNLSEEEPESGSESEEEDVKLAEPSKNSIYNRDSLIEKLQDIS
ncbi:hypothetical protein DITRI_Ditri04bG0188300 [Diplodiscus trichospermus]